jgi:hypothetical protein
MRGCESPTTTTTITTTDDFQCRRQARVTDDHFR